MASAKLMLLANCSVISRSRLPSASGSVGTTGHAAVVPDSDRALVRSPKDHLDAIVFRRRSAQYRGQRRTRPPGIADTADEEWRTVVSGALQREIDLPSRSTLQIGQADRLRVFNQPINCQRKGFRGER